MNMLRYLTSGESHGQSLISIIDGLPSNVELNFDEINAELKKRQCGYGRGGRMKIESDKVNILGGVRGKKTLGGPVSIEVKNRDYQNWTEYMAPMDDVDFETRKVDNVRPGHADLVGCLKYDFTDARNVLERSSARETASRVAVGAICKQVLKNFDIDFVSHVIQIGNVKDENVYDFDYIKNNVDLYVTGSNAFMLSGELATLLSGRYIEIPIYPFSFKEFLQTTELSKEEAFSTYLERGGFPFATELNDNNTYLSYIQGIINTVLIKDILTRVNRGNATLLEAIASFLTEANGSLVTPAKIANTLTSNGIKTSNATVISYLEKLVNSYLFYQCNRYDIAGKKYLQINSKYYPVDPALRRALLGQKRPNMGSRLENIVFMELKRRGYEVYVGSLKNKEIDFVAIKDGVKQYYQVSLTVQDDKTYNREIAPFLEITDNYRKILLTQDPGSYNDNGIEQINVIDWLLKEQ